MKLANNCDLSDGQPCAACQAYMAFESTTSTTQQCLTSDDLMIQRSHICSRVNQNHDLLTRLLPVEIVGTIFESCIPADWDSLDVFVDNDLNKSKYGKGDSWMVSVPLLFGSVCKTWRNIAWATGSLWRVFRLFLDRSDNSYGVTLSREWLERAGQLPLSIRISDSRSLPKSQHGRTAVNQLIALINDRSKQWMNLDILCPPWIISKIQGNLEGAPNLQTLRIGNTLDKAAYDHKGSALFSLVASGLNPRPASLSIHNYPLDSIHIEWNHLTNVFLSQPSLEETIELLRVTPGLLHYKLYAIKEAGTRRHPAPNVAPITYEALETLELDCPARFPSQARQIIHILESFNFPNLKHLKIKSGGKKEWRENRLSWAPVVAHVTRSSPPLISLAIQCLGPNPFTGCIIPILEMSPLLRHLEISLPHKSKHKSGQWGLSLWAEENQLFRLLSNNANFLPNLQSINFRVRHKFKEDANRFWTSIPGIFGPIANIHDPHRRPLKTLRVRVDIQLMKDSFEIESKDVVRQLLMLQENGIILDLKDRYERKDVLEQSIDKPDESDSGEESGESAASWLPRSNEDLSDE